MPYKTYQPTVAVSPGPIAPVGRADDLLREKLDQFEQRNTQQFVGMRRQQEKEAGEEAGSKLGFKPLKEVAPLDAVYNEAGMEAQKSVIHNQIRNGALGIRANVENNLNTSSLGEYDKRYANFSNTLLSNVSDKLRPFAENLVNYYGTANRIPVASKVKGLNNNILKSNLQLSVNNNLQDASKASYFGDTTGALGLYSTSKKMLDSALNTGLISPEYHTEALESMKSTIRMKNYEGSFQRAIDKGEGAKALADFDKGTQSDLTFDDKMKLRMTFNRMLSQNKQDMVAMYGNLDKKAQDMEARILENGVNAGTQGEITNLKSKVLEMYSDDPDKVKEINGSLDTAVMRRTFMDSNKYASPVVISRNLEMMHEGLKKNWDVQNAKRFMLIQKDVKNLMDQRKEDPYALAIKSPTVQSAIREEGLADDGNFSLATGMPMGGATKGNMASIDNAMISVQEGMGIPHSKIMIVPKEQLNALAAKMSSESAEDAYNDMKTVLSAHPENAALAMANIQTVAKGANLMTYNIADNPKTKSRAAYAFQAMNNSAKDLEERSGLNKQQITSLKNDVHDAVAKDWGDSILNRNGDPTKIYDAALDYCYKLALVYRSVGIGSGWFESPAKQAAYDALDAHAQYGSFNGYKYQIPASNQYTPKMVNNSFEALINSINPKSLRVPGYFKSLSPEHVDQKSYKNYLLTHSYPVSNDSGTGIVVLDDSKVPVKTIDKKPIGFTFKDMLSDRSNISKITAEHVSKNRETLERFIDKS